MSNITQKQPVVEESVAPVVEETTVDTEITDIKEYRATKGIPEGHYVQLVGDKWTLIKREITEPTKKAKK